jgi:hypothetical protein
MSCKSWSERFGVLFKGPGWEPGSPRLGYHHKLPQVIFTFFNFTKKLKILSNAIFLGHVSNQKISCQHFKLSECLCQLAFHVHLVLLLWLCETIRCRFKKLVLFYLSLFLCLQSFQETPNYNVERRCLCASLHFDLFRKIFRRPVKKRRLNKL